jgi:F-type H+-transporting ATPase subunit a
MRRYILTLICSIFIVTLAFSQDHPEEHTSGQHGTEQHATTICGEETHHEFDPGATAFHHISDQNVYNIGPLNLPLPCILYVPGEGFHIFSSGKFEIGSHGNGHRAVERFVLIEGSVKRITDPSFPTGEVEISGFVHKVEAQDNGKEKDVNYVCYQEKLYPADSKSTADGGMFGGGITSFYDFSITKNVVSMLLVFLFLGWMFTTIARTYRKREGMAPKGLQSLIEPVILFIQDEVAKPFIGAKWEKYLPFLLSLFFFILALNLFGQIPFLGGSNVTGNLAFTGVLAITTFLVVNLSGNKHYWEHILWMPGAPAWVKTILTPVEFLGIFIKPFTLMLRLCANITAGHIVITIFISLIFIFGKGKMAPSLGTSIGSALLTMFMMAIELLVAFIQAFVFTLLTASYIGAATEEAHHAEEGHH